MAGKDNGGGRRRISPQERRLLVADYLLTGNLAEVARKHGMTSAAVCKSKSRPWWNETLDEIRDDILRQDRARIRRLFTKALETMEERLEFGNEELSRDGPIRVRVNLRDTTLAAQVLLSLGRVMDGQPLNISSNLNLGDLAQKLANLALEHQAKTIEGQVVRLSTPIDSISTPTS